MSDENTIFFWETMTIHVFASLLTGIENGSWSVWSGHYRLPLLFLSSLQPDMNFTFNRSIFLTFLIIIIIIIIIIIHLIYIALFYYSKRCFTE